MDAQNDNTGLLATLAGEQGFYILLFVYLGMIAGERILFLFQRRHTYDDWNALGSMAVSTLSQVTASAILIFLPLAGYWEIYADYRLATPGMVWWTWVLAFLGHDLAYYLAHRVGHRTGFFWAIHHPHHSSEALNFTTASRGFPFGDPLAPLFALPLALIGVTPVQFVVVALLKSIWGIFNHTVLIDRMGVLDEVLCTPSVHRVHHGRNAQYIDKNYGQVLTLWDRLFGTFEHEVEQPDYGTIKPVTSNNPLIIVFAGFAWLIGKMRAMPRWQDALACLWRPPEWKPSTMASPATVSR